MFCATVCKIPWHFCSSEAGYTRANDIYEQEVAYPTSVTGISCTQPEDLLSDCTFRNPPSGATNIATTLALGVQCERKLL